jgi:hypothetical protein
VLGWDPVSLSDTIVVQEVEGAGRGRGFRTVSEEDATESATTELDLLAMARRSLEIVEICLKSSQVFASDLVDNVPWQLQEEVVREKAEDYGYRESTS